MDITYTISELENVARQIKDYIEKCPCRVIALYGEMGAGKTTLTTALVALLGSTDSTGSPTFSIINQYNTVNGHIIYHMDWYRLRDEEEAIQAGVEDALYSGNWCIVEWPEKAEGLLPERFIKIFLAHGDAITRHLKVII